MGKRINKEMRIEKALEDNKSLLSLLKETERCVIRVFFCGRCMLTKDLISDLEYYDIDYIINSYEKTSHDYILKLDGDVKLFIRY